MHPANWTSLGWLTLQDWDNNRDIDKKHVVGAMRMEEPEDPEDIIPGNLSEGHVLGGMHWEEDGGREGVDAWWLTPPAVRYHEPPGPSGSGVSESDDPGEPASRPTTGSEPVPRPITGGGTIYGSSPDSTRTRTRTRPPPVHDADSGGTTGRTRTRPVDGGNQFSSVTGDSSGWNVLENADTEDPALPSKSPLLPGWARGIKYPVGWVATVLSGSKNVLRGPQDEILLPGFFGIVAPNRAGVPAMGTAVWELNNDKEPDFFGRAQSLISVEKVGAGALALQLGKSNLDATSGFLLLSDWSDGDGFLASASAYQGGPLLTGGVDDQHQIGVSADGKPINAAHLSTQSLFKGSGFDCPLLFEATSWPKPDSGPHKLLVHLVNDEDARHPWVKGVGDGYGRWYTDAFFYADDPPPPPEDGPGVHGPEDPFGTGNPPPTGGGGGGGVTGGGGGDVFVPGGDLTGGHSAGGGGLPTGGIFGPGGGGIPFDDGGGTGGGDGDGGSIPPVHGGLLGPGAIPIPGGGGGAGGDGSGGSVVFIEDSNGNLVQVVPPDGLSPDELREWTEKNWGQDPPYDPPETSAVHGEVLSPGRPKWAAASNTVLFGGGLAYKAQAYTVGQRDLTGATSVSSDDKNLAARAPVVGYLAAYGQGDGAWDGWVYAAGRDGSDGNRPAAAGGTMLLPPDVTVADVISGVASSDAGPVSQVYPYGMSDVAWGTPDPGTGGIHTGIVARADGTGGVSLVAYDADAAVIAAIGVNFGEGGFNITGDASVTGKLTVGGMIDPVGIAFDEQASRPAAWPQPSGGVYLPGLYAGDTAGANEAWWVFDDGTEVNLAAASGGAGGISVLDSQAGDVGNVGGGQDTLKTYTLPGGTMADNDSVRITAWGSAGITGTAEGDITLEFGGTSLVPAGALASTTAKNWRIEAIVSRVSESVQRANANTDLALTSGNIATSPAEDLSGNVIIKVTGTNNDTTDNDAAVCKGFVVELLKAP